MVGMPRIQRVVDYYELLLLSLRIDDDDDDDDDDGDDAPAFFSAHCFPET